MHTKHASTNHLWNTNLVKSTDKSSLYLNYIPILKWIAYNNTRYFCAICFIKSAPLSLLPSFLAQFPLQKCGNSEARRRNWNWQSHNFHTAVFACGSVECDFIKDRLKSNWETIDRIMSKKYCECHIFATERNSLVRQRPWFHFLVFNIFRQFNFTSLLHRAFRKFEIHLFMMIILESRAPSTLNF